jgi:hypothetical protein
MEGSSRSQLEGVIQIFFWGDKGKLYEAFVWKAVT